MNGTMKMRSFILLGAMAFLLNACANWQAPGPQRSYRAGPASAGIKITLKGVESYDELNEIKKELRWQVSGIQSISQKSFHGSVAVIEVKADETVTAEDIADGLTKIRVRNLPFQVTTATAYSVEASLGP